MNDLTRKILLSSLVALTLAVPAAVATWQNDGDFEPNTIQDATDGYMYADPDTSPSGKKVYFNAWADVDYSGASVNNGFTHSRIYTSPTVVFNAVLGVWKDCNKDGFIGMADGNLAEYSVALLSTTEVCFAEPFIHEGFVYEFLWSGPADQIGDAEDQANYGPHGLINDTATRVWHDWGLPGQVPRPTCALTPFPAGMTASTGGTISYVDCIISRRVQDTSNMVDPDGSLGIGFGDDTKGGDSVVNQSLPVHPFYDPYNADSTGFYERDSGDAAFAAFDCSAPTPVADPTGGQIAGAEDPTGGELWDGSFRDDGNLAYVGAPAPAVADPTDGIGSFRDGLNNTYAGAVGDCETGAPWVVVEDQHGSVDGEKGRMEHDTSFRFFTHLDNAATYDDDDAPGTIPEHPQDLGLTLQRPAAGLQWQGTTGWVTVPQLVSTRSGQPVGPQYATFYATVGDATLSVASVPSASPATYGAEWCFGATTGVKGGFDCDASHWWNKLHDAGTSDPETETGGTINAQCTTGLKEADWVDNCREMSVKPGQAYHLRDIECYDGQLVEGVPVYASLVQLSNAEPQTCVDAS